jgi:hypothetical protein
MRGLATATIVILFAGHLQAQDATRVTIRLEHNSQAEALMARQLDSLLLKYNLEPWILTRAVLIDERSIPHSHPVLTLHTRHLGDEIMLLSTFLHEQLHWLEEARPEPFRTAMREFRDMFPQVPASNAGGASDDASTYRHLLVCDLELQALSALLGERRARETLSRITHYQWIYDKVLNDSRIRQVSLRNGFNVSESASPRPAQQSLRRIRRHRQAYPPLSGFW